MRPEKEAPDNAADTASGAPWPLTCSASAAAIVWMWTRRHFTVKPEFVSFACAGVCPLTRERGSCLTVNQGLLKDRPSEVKGMDLPSPTCGVLGKPAVL